MKEKKSNAAEHCVGEWLTDDVENTDSFFPSWSDVADSAGFWTDVELCGGGWQIVYAVKDDLASEDRKLAETIAKAPAAHYNYSMLLQEDYKRSLHEFGSVMAKNMGKGLNFKAHEEFFKLYVGGDVTRARWDYTESPCLGTFTATASERSSATAQCNAGGDGSSLVQVKLEQEVHKGAPGGVVIYSNQDGKFPLVRGSVLTLTFDLRNSTSVTERTIAHEGTCCVCMDRPPVAWKAGAPVACPEGHNAVCEECLLALKKSGCPLCRAPWNCEAVAPIRADAKARAELAAWLAAELEREQAMQAAEAAARAAAAAAEEKRLSDKINKRFLEILVGEGFAYQLARVALDLCDNDLETAKRWFSEKPLGQLCSKYGVDPDSPVYKAVENMEQADQELVLRELHVVNVQLPFDPCDALGRPVVMDGLARGAPKVGVPGAPCAKWLLRVSVSLHDGKEDKLGEVLEVSDVSGILREYKVQPAKLINVKIWNYCLGTINFTPAYIPADGEPEPDQPTKLLWNDEYELPYPIQMDKNEKPDMWVLMSETKQAVLKLRFSVSISPC